VAVVQAAPRLFDPAATLDRFGTLLAEAAGGGARLVVFPEAFIGGYPKGSAFGAVVGERSAAGRLLFARYRRCAVEVPGDTLDAIRAQVARHAVHTVVGVVERAGGTLYCSALLLGPDGTLLGHHRKLVPTGTERLIWGCGDASDVAVIGTDIGRIGLAICWENYLPLYRMALYERQVQLYCAPTVDGRQTWTATMRHIAVEGRCFVLSANQFATRRDYPDGWPAGGPDPAGDQHPASRPAPAGDPDSTVIAGGSCIIDPLGQVLAGPSFDRAGILMADLDLDALDGAYLDLDVAGHYARPDLFRLTTTPAPPRHHGSPGAPPGDP
jgi:nitrilase